MYEPRGCDEFLTDTFVPQTTCLASEIIILVGNTNVANSYSEINVPRYLCNLTYKNIRIHLYLDLT